MAGVGVGLSRAAAISPFPSPPRFGLTHTLRDLCFGPASPGQRLAAPASRPSPGKASWGTLTPSQNAMDAPWARPRDSPPGVSPDAGGPEVELGGGEVLI